MRTPRLVDNALLILGAAGFLVLIVLLPSGNARTIAAVFSAFAILPGLIGIANHLVRERQQRLHSNVSSNHESDHSPTLYEMLASAMILSAVFLVVARGCISPAKIVNMDGWVFAGFGAYISTLWFMLVRLNANALSPRFLINSALKASIAMLIGLVASESKIFPAADSLPSLYFCIGLFHAWALQSLKQTALKTFGITEPTSAELSVRMIQGVDDDAMDVLEETGITSVQHLATMHVPEICGRSLYPRARVLDWIDQSILAMHTNGRLPELRTVGIHSAWTLVTIVEHTQHDGGRLKPAAEERLEEAAKRLGTTCKALQLVAECIRLDPAYIALEAEHPNRHKPPSDKGAPTSEPHPPAGASTSLLTEPSHVV